MNREDVRQVRDDVAARIGSCSHPVLVGIVRLVRRHDHHRPPVLELQRHGRGRGLLVAVLYLFF